MKIVRKTLPIILFVAAAIAFAGLRLQTIQNNSIDARNDLIVVFKGIISLNSAKIEPRKQPPGKNAEVRFGAGSLTVTFPQAGAGSFGSVSGLDPTNQDTTNSSKADLIWDSGVGLNTAVIDTEKSKWSLDGAPLNNIATLGTPAKYTPQKQSPLEGFFTFFNPDDAASAVTYTDIQLFKDNDIASFFFDIDIDAFLTPTGSAVALSPIGSCTLDGPTSITLTPGASCTFALGLVDSSGYELAVANVVSTGDPTNIFRVATAERAEAGLPEPATLALLGIGLAGLAFSRRRKLD